MKEGLEYKKLGEICDILNGFAFKSSTYVADGIRVIRISNVQKGKVEDKDPKFFPSSSKGEIENYLLNEGDLLISLTGNVGRVGILLRELLPAALNQRVACLRLKRDNIDKRYLFHFLNSDYFESICIKNSKGAAQLNMSTVWLSNYAIPVPPLSEQQRIVDYLDAAFAKIDAMKANAEKSLNEAKALFQASLKEMLEPKEGWEEKTINDVAVFRNGVAHEKDIEEGGGYIVINSKFVATEGSIKKYTNKQLSPLYTNEIVMVMSDVPKGKTLAKCYIIECDDKYSLNQRICAFKSKGLDMKFLYYILNRNPHLLKYDNGENQTNLRKKQIIECPVAYPPQKKEQQSIVDYLDFLKSKVDRLQANCEKISQECDALKQAILKQVFE